MAVRTLGVLGAGQMGSGIAQVAALAGFDVVLGDVDQGTAEKGKATIARFLGRSVEKGQLPAADRDAALGRVTPVADVARVAAADLVIEAASEREALKLDLFRALDRAARPETILASNTSSISITTLAAATSRADRVIGMHFFNPVPLMGLVEVIRGLETSDATVEVVTDLARRLGKTPVEARDFPGFIANRILMPMINEAVYALMEGVGTAEAIDTVMKLGMNHPMGPLALADLIGLDTCLAILEVLHEGLGDPKYRPCPLLRQYVAAGRLGRKSGRGFYTY
ncbi:MAG TPA: 3-hydroxybutyryl-CoA dehydrogenase [Thermodesulfobacteriota bacterium]